MKTNKIFKPAIISLAVSAAMFSGSALAQQASTNEVADDV